MKSLLPFSLLLISLNVFSQSQKEMDSLRNILKFQNEEIQKQHVQIKLLIDKIEDYQWISEEISKMRRENEALKNIIKLYILQIDSLNIQLQNVNSSLEKCTNNLKQQTNINKPKVTESSNLRPRLTEISEMEVRTAVETKIIFLLEVNADGNVISGRVIEHLTTTNDSELIQKIFSICKSQLKYAKREGVTQEYYTVIILPEKK